MRAPYLLAAVAVFALAPRSLAHTQPAGSLLVFPEFDNRDGVRNIYSITNTNPTESVTVEIVYIDKEDCSEFNRNIELTPNDTFTFLTKFHNPQMERGYAYAFAKDSANGEAISFDWLVGNSLVVDAVILFNYSTNPFVFQGVPDDGMPTDLDGDDIRDLDGAEYTQAPDKLIVPRFFAQTLKVQSKLILIGLTGSQFSTTVDFLIYNDNEEVFSAEYTFDCWKEVDLLDISGVFAQNFLVNNTNDDPTEVYGAPFLTTGWFQMDGAVANSTATTMEDPAFLAVLHEGLMILRGADLPFTLGEQDNGDLLPRSVMGDM
jgi:hypothetical protein